MNTNHIQKIIALAVLVVTMINPVLSLALTPPPPTTQTTANGTQYNPYDYSDPNNPYNPNNPSLNPAFVQSQIQNSGSYVTAQQTQSQANTQSTTAQSNNSAFRATGSAASCLSSKLLSQAITQAASTATESVLEGAGNMILNVPTAESGGVAGAIKTEASARVGSGISIGGLDIPLAPSWDAVAYCIVNTMIIYIADSTIQWINTGFEGNPAFLNNPDQFFEDLANREKAAFLQNLAYGVNSSVCGVFKSSVVTAILSRYGKNQQMYGNPQQGYQNGGYNGANTAGMNNGTGGYTGGGTATNGAYPNGTNGTAGGTGYNGVTGASGMPLNICPFDQNPGQLNTFVNGNFSAGGGWNSWFQVSQGSMANPYDTLFSANDRLNNQIQAVQISQNRELTWNNGYLSFRKCSNGEKDKSKCPITTPGTVIQNQLNETLNLGKNRLVLAEKFDQVVTAVLDQLITTSLDKALDLNQYNSGDYSSSNSNMYNNSSIGINARATTTPNKPATTPTGPRSASSTPLLTGDRIAPYRTATTTVNSTSSNNTSSSTNTTSSINDSSTSTTTSSVN